MDLTTGAKAGEAGGVGTTGKAEEEILDGVVGMVAEGNGIVGGAELAPELEAATAGSDFGAFAGALEVGDGEVVQGEGNVPGGAELAAPRGVGIGIGATQAVVDVMGDEGEVELAEEEQESGAVGPAAEADEKAVDASQTLVFGEVVPDASGQLVGVVHGRSTSRWWSGQGRRSRGRAGGC